MAGFQVIIYGRFWVFTEVCLASPTPLRKGFGRYQLTENKAGYAVGQHFDASATTRRVVALGINDLRSDFDVFGVLKTAFRSPSALPDPCK